MKKHLFFRTLLVLIGVLITSLTSQVKAWNTLFLASYENGWNTSADGFGNSSNGKGSVFTYMPANSDFAIYNSYAGWLKRDLGDELKPGDGGMNFDKAKGNNCQYTGKSGIVEFHCDQTGSNADDYPWIWITRPTVYIRHNWNDAGWSNKSMTDNNDGTYSYTGKYSGSNSTNVGPCSSCTDGGDKFKYFSDATLYGSPSKGDNCLFKYNSDGFRGRGGSSSNKGSLKIYKLVTITYNANSSTSGTKPANQEVPYNLASTLATNSGSLAKTNYVFTGWNTKSDGSGTHYDAGGSITITSNITLYAEWNRKWAVQGSGTEMGAWSEYKYLAPTGTSNEFSGTIELAANTTYKFKLRNRQDNSLWGYGDDDYQLAFIGQSGAYSHDLESTSGKKDLVLMTAKAGTYTFTYNQSTKRLTVGFPSQTHPNTDNIYFRNNGASPYSGVCVHIWGGSTGSTGWNRLPTMPTCTIAGQAYKYAAIGDNNTCKFANAANTNTKTENQTSVDTKKGMYYDLNTNTWKSFTFSITYKDQGNVAFSGSHSATPPSTHTFGSSTTLKSASKTGYTFGGWFTNSSCTGSAVATLGATDYTDNITLYAKWTPITYTVRYYSNSASYIGTATDTTAVSSHTYDVAKNLTSNGFNLTGYTFGGWGTATGTSAATYSDGESVSNLSSTNGATVPLYARWNIQSYTLTWNLAGGKVTTAGTGAAVDDTGTPSSSVTYNASITAPEVEKTGYTFAGWDVSPASNMPAANTTYTATWTAKTNTPYTVNHYQENLAGDGYDLVDTDNLTGTTDASVTPATKSYTGFTAPSTQTVTINADGSRVVTYNYTRNSYTLTWSLDGGSISVAGTAAGSVKYGASLTAPTVIRTGYNFSAWSPSVAATMPAANTEYTATWTIKTYSITLSALSTQVSGGESTTNGSASVTYMGTSLTSIVAPTRPGYEVEYYTLNANGNNTVADNEGALEHGLLGYLTNDGEWIYDDNLTIYAHWVPKTYTITLDANRDGIPGTAGSISFSVTIGSNNFDFDLSTVGRQSMTPPTKEGYTFAGYYDDPDDGEGTKVINADGSKPATSYVNSDGNWINSDDDLTLYAHWNDDYQYYYKGETADGWSTAGNWTKGRVPSTENKDTIHILKPLVISSDKKVAAVDIITNGSYTPTGGDAIEASGKLTIQANKGLNVTGTVTRTADATSNLATREGDLVLESSSAGNASLIFDNSYSCQATVQMYSKASISGSTWNWQYVGTPFTGSIPLYNYYGSWMYKWNNGGWDVVKGSDELTPFAGYCLTQESATTHVMGGTLVPTTSKSVTMSASTDMVLANSWTAPIYIGGFTASTFTSTPATIYLFNTGSAENGSSVGSEAGTYVAIPIFTTPYVGGGLIAPMQGFFVTTNGGSAGTITMNYADLVRPADSRSIVAGPMYAPKRAEEGDEPVLQDQPEEAPTVLKIWANGSVYNDRLVILAREDFSEGFDNGWDGSKMSFGVASPSVYVINAQGGYDAVSAIPNLEGTVIGFRAGEDKVCTMTFDYNGEEIWYLNDLQEQRSTEINSEINYPFTTSAGDSEVRFIVSKTPINHMPTGIEEISDQNSVVRKQMIDDKLYIIRGGRIYSAQGALVK